MRLSVKSLLLDYGGTIDTNGLHWGEVIWQAYSDNHVSVSRDKFREVYVQVERMLGSQSLILPNHTFKETLEIKIKLQFEALGIIDDHLENQIVNSCYKTVCFHTRNAASILEQLKARYPMYLVSNFYGNLQTVLCEFGLTDYFQAVIESAEVGYRKPDLEIFRIAIEKTGNRPEEVVIIGDSYKNDIQPATLLGCPSIWLKVKGWHDADETIEHPCIINDFSALPPVIARASKK